MDICLLKLLHEYGISCVAPHYNGVHSSIVNTHQGSLNLVKTVSEAMNQICLYFGSDLEGRKKASRLQYKLRKNPPIIISDALYMVAFQLPSMLKNEYVWIFDLNYKIEENREKKNCKLIFDNGFEIEIPLSRESINTYRNRAIHLLYEVTSNVNYAERRIGFLGGWRQMQIQTPQNQIVHEQGIGYSISNT
ncbi:competence protein ComK [Ureibacillus manganicus]|uniref:Competence protein ComK n=1 Tax=Ureibacillus manganicus DSM 26584 TaxID=1384049 RepID=A0A0A3HVF1_9BACL|nr:competence protein ComK [Ureibacillus manganicus]KGR76419.1 hypothetical protein CD29_17005 [Ureibacillus manganicus DSM 26584]